jgi:hypothetical protein
MNNRLPSNSCFGLLEQIAVLIRSKATVKTRRSILEIQGMGKNILNDLL